VKKWALVLGCHGLMAGSAQAGERWPVAPCRDTQQGLAELEQLYAKSPGAIDKLEIATVLASGRQGLLILLRDHCPVDVSAKIAQDLAAFNASAARGEGQAIRARRGPAPRHPVLCDTTPRAYGGSTTDCF
jgi:hypothetical protein